MQPDVFVLVLIHIYKMEWMLVGLFIYSFVWPNYCSKLFTIFTQSFQNFLGENLRPRTHLEYILVAPLIALLLSEADYP